MRNKDREASEQASNNATFSRRNMLLAGTTFAAVSALAIGSAGADRAGGAEAAAGAAAGGKRPNILVIFGDDIGQTNISAYSFGLMGYQTPNIDRIAREGMMFTDYYAEQSCTAGRVDLHHRAMHAAHRPVQGRYPGRHRGPAGAGRDHRRAAQAARLCHRPVRQEPPRRPQRVSADGARLRRILRQSLPPQRRGRAGEPRTIRRTRIPRRSSARAACCDAGRPTRTIRPSIRAAAGSAGRPSRTPARSPRSAWRRSTTRRRLLPSTSCERQAKASKPFFCWFNSTRMHFRTHVRDEHRGKPGLTATPNMPTA